MGICILVQVALLALAILSRMHFSKYKVYRKQIGFAISVMFVSVVFSEILIWKDANAREPEQTVLERADYDGLTRTEEICLLLDDKEYFYTLKIEPIEYTEEEFRKLAQNQSEILKKEILQDNPDSEHISSNLLLPQEDEAGIFSYEWCSDRPEIISSFGEVCTEKLAEGDVPVVLTLTVSYRTYEAEFDFLVNVRKTERREDAVRQAEEELQRLEEDTRTSGSVTLPEQYGDVQIQKKEKTTGQAMKPIAFGIAVICMAAVIGWIRQKETIKKQNHVLLCQYPSFVNQLWLLLGAGMTIQAAIRRILSEMGKDSGVLKKEMEYAVHRLDTGCEESRVYEQLGRDLILPEYEQLFIHVSQHIRMGTKDLRNLMELEMQTALRKKRESAKKQGEEASTKLLFPMIVLLALVMIMIVYPAMSRF